MKIGIVGGGTVGRATARAFVEHAEVRVYDVMPERSTHRWPEVAECDLVFVCLPTPQEAGGQAADLAAVDRFFGDAKAGDLINFVLRSTVPVGTTKRLREKYGLANLVHSPEFLTARCAATDAQLPARNIVGGVVCRAAVALHELYERRFPGVPVLRMSSDASEAVKLVLNGFFAVKVAFFNEARSLADALGLDWGSVLAGVLSDGRVAHAHTQVPGPDGKHGFGGTCLPKDLASFVHHLGEQGLCDLVSRGALLRNAGDRQR